jgi:predicted metalloprotease
VDLHQVAKVVLGAKKFAAVYALLVSDLRPGPPATAGPRRSRRRRSVVFRLIGTAAAAILVILLGNQAVSFLHLGPEPSSSGGSGTPSSDHGGKATMPAGPKAIGSGGPTASGPSAGSRSTANPPEPNRSLIRNSMYRVDLDGVRVACGIKVRSPRPPLRNAQLAAYTRSLLDCMVKVFRRPLGTQGFSLATPKVDVYRSSIKSPCGRFDQKGAPAYYCSANKTIYWPATRDDGREAYTFARLGYIALTAHEFGHHLQATTGMVNEYGRRYAAADSKSERYLLSRRLELQAQCFEGVFLETVARSIGFNAADRTELRMWHSYTGDEDPPSSRKPDHGTSAAQIRWLDRGLDSQDFGRCNTWAAPKSAVR